MRTISKKFIMAGAMASVVVIGLASNVFAKELTNKQYNDMFAKVKEENYTLKEFSKPITIKLRKLDKSEVVISKSFKNKPKVVNNRTAIAVRDLSEALKADIKWDAQGQLIKIKKDGNDIALKNKKPAFIKDSELVNIDTSTIINPKENRTYLPLRSIAEILGYDVDFDKDTFTAILFEKEFNAAIKGDDRLIKLYHKLDKQDNYPEGHEMKPLMEDLIKYTSIEKDLWNKKDEFYLGALNFKPKYEGKYRSKINLENYRKPEIFDNKLSKYEDIKLYHLTYSTLITDFSKLPEMAKYNLDGDIKAERSGIKVDKNDIKYLGSLNDVRNNEEFGNFRDVKFKINPEALRDENTEFTNAKYFYILPNKYDIRINILYSDDKEGMIKLKYYYPIAHPRYMMDSNGNWYNATRFSLNNIKHKTIVKILCSNHTNDEMYLVDIPPTRLY